MDRAMPKTLAHYRFNVLLTALLLIAAGPLAAQSPACNSKAPSDPANWRRVPYAIGQSADTVSPNVRKERDDYWVRLIPPPNSDAPAFIDEDYIDGSTIPGTENYEPYNPKRFWVVGVFTGYSVYEAAPGLLYTEIHLRIDRIVGTHPKPNAPAVGSVVDVDIAGGCIKTPNGEVKDFWSSSYEYKMRPGHRYLVEICLAAAGGFYDDAYPLADLTSGKAQPVRRLAVGAASMGQWKYLDLSEDAAIRLVEGDAARNN